MLFFSTTFLFSQRWESSKSCHENANDPDLLNIQATRSGAISAAIKLRISKTGTSDSFCSGVMINRNTSDDEVGYYFLTAKHCVDDIDSNVEHEIYFNYQSPDGDNSSTALSNRGETAGQSTSLEDDAHQYLHLSRLRVVNTFTWGDFALVEILTAVPPHFNFTYAGWNPNKFYDLSIGFDASLPTKYYGVHHPAGDIKKVSGSNSVLWLETPIATGCYTITSVVDFLFGWIWGNETSTSVICNYVDNPWVVVPIWDYGASEGGASGSAIFNSSNKVFGVLSGSTEGCTIGTTTYGKLHANFSNASIKNTLNPQNNSWVDAFGLDERKITKYTDLNLPGAEGVSGHYFPANHYQSENLVTLSAQNTIITTQPITVYEGAEYKFVAGESINLGPGFRVQSDANFSAVIGSSSSKTEKQTLEEKMLAKLKTIDLPEYKKFELKTSTDREEGSVDVFIYPNPTDNVINISTNETMTNYKLLNSLGNQLLEKEVNTTNTSINIQNLPSGIYILQIRLASGEVVVKKVIKN